jgi:hypothetical protein
MATLDMTFVQKRLALLPRHNQACYQMEATWIRPKITIADPSRDSAIGDFNSNGTEPGKECET